MADLRVTKDVSRTQVTVNPASAERTRLTYTIMVTNLGPGTATDVVVTDTLPGGVVPVSAVPSVGSCTRAGGGSDLCARHAGGRGTARSL